MVLTLNGKLVLAFQPSEPLCTVIFLCNKIINQTLHTLPFISTSDQLLKPYHLGMPNSNAPCIKGLIARFNSRCNDINTGKWPCRLTVKTVQHKASKSEANYQARKSTFHLLPHITSWTKKFITATEKSTLYTD
jgi:hypothetical protein